MIQRYRLQLASSIGLALGGCLVVIVSCQTLKEESAVQKARYAKYAVNRIGAQLVGNLPTDATHIPASVPGADAIHDDLLPLENVDPFNSRREVGKKLRTVHYKGGRFDLKFTGVPFSYVRIDAERAVFYSLGPDERDDTATVLEEQSNGISIEDLRTLAGYDPSNGVNSSGDIGLLLPEFLYY
jgi:hypothetical protein